MMIEQNRPAALLRMSWAALLACLVGTTLAVAKIPFASDKNPVIERFSGPQFAVLSLTASVALVALLIAWALRRVSLKISPAHWALLVFLALASISSAQAAVLPLSLVGESGRYVGLTTWVLASAAFFVASQLVADEERRRAITLAFIVTGTLEAIIGLSQVLGMDFLRFDFPDAFLWTLAQGIGTLGNPNHYASVLVAPFVLAVAAVPLARTALQRYLAASCAALMCVALVASATRGSWVGAIAGVVIVVVAFMMSPKIRKQAILRSLAALIVILIIGVGISDRGILLTRFDASSGTEIATADRVSNGRLTIWSQAGRIVASHPLLGIGSDSLRNAWKSSGMTTGDRKIFVDDTHSLPIMLIVCFGIPGGLAFVALVALVFWPRNEGVLHNGVSERERLEQLAWKAAVAAMLVNSLVSVLSVPYVLMLMLGLGAVLSFSAPSRRADVAEVATMQTSPARWLLVLAAVALSAGALYASFTPLYYNFRLTYQEKNPPLSDQALGTLTKANVALPWRYEMIGRWSGTILFQGLIEEREGSTVPGTGRERVDELLRDLDALVERYPAEHTAWVARARVYTIAGLELRDSSLTSQAQDIVTEALARFPMDPDLLAISAELKS